MGFFITTEPYKRTITAPGGDEGEVTMRRLNAGDQAAIQDTLRMSLDESADASMAIGTMRMLTVQKAVIDWSWPGPKPSPEAIAQLEPEVFEQIYAHCEIGSPPTQGQASSDGAASAAEAPTEIVPSATVKARQRAATAS